MEAFNDELNSFRERIKARAKARIEEALKEYEEVSNCVCVYMYVCECACVQMNMLALRLLLIQLH